MSAIFLSHSSADNAAAAQIKAWLEDQGHRSIFLDFDPEAGIPAGRSWERELYQQLRSCRAVMVLASEHSMASRWCFAEITHARSLGKHIFPLKIGPCTIDSVLTDRQVIDLTSDRAAGLVRLAAGLEAAGIDAADPYDWDGSRSPYPGLLAFQEGDAAVFFGRDAEIGSGLDVLNQVKWQGGAGVMMILGASGSGKSSLLRAGLLPRLRRDLDRWSIVGPFRPGGEPWRELAGALAQTFAAAGERRAWKELYRELTAGDRAAALGSIAEDLRLCSGHPEAAALVVVDQFEELLGQPPDHPATVFLAALRSVVERPGSGVVVLATMRSDFLATFQQAPALAGLDFKSLSVGPLAVEGLTQVVERPAACAGVDLEPGLVQAILEDAETEDALPLLAFTLRELYEGYGDDGRLALADYRQSLGGLQGAVAKVADGVIEESRLAADEEQELRAVFLEMVRINREGQFARRPLAWSEVSDRVRPLLERFVGARLLVSRGGDEAASLEVAHEALFRAWDKLAGWLAESREDLHLRSEIARAAAQWAEGGRAKDYQWRKGRLARAVELRDGRRLGLDNQAREFVAASERTEQRAKLRRRRLRRGVLAAALTVAAVTSVSAWLAVAGRKEAVAARKKTEVQLSRSLAVLARTGGYRLDLGLLLAVEAARQPTFESRTALYHLLAAEPRTTTFLHGHRELVWSLAWSPGGVLASGSADRTVRLWDVGRRQEIRELEHPQPVLGVAFGDDGRVMGLGSGRLEVWDRQGVAAESADGGLEPSPAGVFTVAFGPDRRRLAYGTSGGEVWVREAGGLRSCPAADCHDGFVNQLAFHPDGKLLASAGRDGTVRLWRLAAGALELAWVRGGHRHGARSVAFDPRGEVLVSGSGEGRLWLLDPATGEPLAPPTAGHSGPVAALAFDPHPGPPAPRGTLASGSIDGALRRWTISERRELEPGFEVHVRQGGIWSLAYSPDGKMLASGSRDGAIRLWTLEPLAPRAYELAGQEWETRGFAFGADGRWAATGDQDGTVRFWELAPEAARIVSAGEPIRPGGEVLALALSADGGTLAAAGSGQDNRLILWDRLAGRERFSLPGGGAWFHDLAWSGDGGTVAAARGELVWTTLARDTVALPGSRQVTSVAYDPTGRWLASGDEEGVLWLWDLTRPEPAAVRLSSADEHQHEGGIRSLAWSADGRTLASGGEDDDVRLWQPATGSFLRTLSGHEGWIRGLAFSPGGDRLASASDDWTIRVWQVSSGEPLFELLGHTGIVYRAIFTDRGGEILSGSDDRTLRRWAVGILDPLEGARELACRRANRDLTRDERRDFLGRDDDPPPNCARYLARAVPAARLSR